ncbi:Uncharacterized protein TCM_001584 [Theobroma cacao]|uniref:Uncharacterized protein n=1 Tax=Theobroma cacao TaxID=3641 RepID=A0A061DK02_THECC|nr:Uncharacterized protein TCM_001584 [Theobroma cacao]
MMKMMAVSMIEIPSGMAILPSREAIVGDEKGRGAFVGRGGLNGDHEGEKRGCTVLAGIMAPGDCPRRRHSDPTLNYYAQSSAGLKENQIQHEQPCNPCPNRAFVLDIYPTALQEMPSLKINPTIQFPFASRDIPPAAAKPGSSFALPSIFIFT